MVINTDLLVKHSAQYKMNKDTAAELYRQLFILHPDVAHYYDAEDLDPDSIIKANKFIMYGQSEMRYFFQLPAAFGQEAKWRTALASFKEQFADVGYPLMEFNKEFDAFLKAMEKHAGGVSAEQKQNWMELLNKAYSDMKEFKWF